MARTTSDTSGTATAGAHGGPPVPQSEVVQDPLDDCQTLDHTGRRTSRDASVSDHRDGVISIISAKP